jgi:DNA-binding CsgD family transcriptional regulator
MQRSSSEGRGRFPLEPAVWRRVAERMQLSPQQERIVEMLLEGRKCKEIGPALGLAIPTVRTYLKRIYDRIGVSDQTELLLHIMALAQERDEVPERPPTARRVR